MTNAVETQFRKLAMEWRDRAEVLRGYGAEASATALTACAHDLECYLQAWLLETLTLEDAAAESGYSYSSLQKKVASGELPNAGDKGSPRVLRKDLPYKAMIDRSQDQGIVEELLLRRL